MAGPQMMTIEHAFKAGVNIGIELGKRDSSQSQGETYEQAKCDAWLAYEATVGLPASKNERAVMVCPQCEGEGGYPDGVDEAACHTACTRCEGNGWIVDLAAILSLGIGDHSGDVEKARTTLWQSHHYWLRAAKEALQGDLGKLRRHVAISEGFTRDTVLESMTAVLKSPHGGPSNG